MIPIVLAVSSDGANTFAALALVLSSFSVLVSLLALRFTKASKVAEMRKELVTRHVAIRDAVLMMRVKAVARDNPKFEPSFEEAFDVEDSGGFKKAYDEAIEKLEKVKAASDSEVLRLYSQELPSLDSFARGASQIAEEYGKPKKRRKGV